MISYLSYEAQICFQNNEQTVSMPSPYQIYLNIFNFAFTALLKTATFTGFHFPDVFYAFFRVTKYDFEAKYRYGENKTTFDI